VCPYPRHTFTEEEMMLSLKELQLHPNGVVIISSLDLQPQIPPSNTTISASPSPSWINYMYNCFQILKNFVYHFIWPPTNLETIETTSPSRTPPSSRNVTNSSREDNVHRLNHDDDLDEDRNKYWNGNSTQQQ